MTGGQVWRLREKRIPSRRPQKHAPEKTLFSEGRGRKKCGDRQKTHGTSGDSDVHVFLQQACSREASREGVITRSLTSEALQNGKIKSGGCVPGFATFTFPNMFFSTSGMPGEKHVRFPGAAVTVLCVCVWSAVQKDQRMRI